MPYRITGLAHSAGGELATSGETAKKALEIGANGPRRARATSSSPTPKACPTISTTLPCSLVRKIGVRPFRWTASCCGFDQALGVLILEVDGTAVAER